MGAIVAFAAACAAWEIDRREKEFAILLLLRAAAADAQITLTQGTNFGIDVAADGRLTIDLLGGFLKNLEKKSWMLDAWRARKLEAVNA